MLGISLALTPGNPILSSGYDPVAALGSSLFALWDAERLTTVTKDGSNLVSGWADAKNGYTPTQATAGFKPTYSANSFNGRPSISFDGSDDYLGLAATPLPTGANPCEIWALVDQAAAAADTTQRVVAEWGSATNDRRSCRRSVAGGINLATTLAGNGPTSFSASAVGDFSGRHIVRSEIGADSSAASMDGAGRVTTAIVPATGTARTFIGANASTASPSGGFWQGKVNIILVTAALTSPQAASLLAFLKQRGGIF